MSIESMRPENEEFRRRLEEAEDALRAIRAGEVDALIVGSEQEQVYTLESPDKPYRLLVEQFPQAAATLTTYGSIIYCNRLFADLLGRPPQSLAGTPLRDFVAEGSRAALEVMLREGETHDSEAEITIEAAGRSARRYLGISCVKEGALGLCLMVADLTEQRYYKDLERAQADLRATTERLELAQKVGRVGTFDWDIRSDVLNASSTAEELYGLPPGGFVRYEDWKRSVHPADRVRAEADVLHAVNERVELDSEFRIMRPDGGIRWIAAKARVFGSDTGDAVRMLGVVVDITERKNAEEQLRRARDEARTANFLKDQFLATVSHELRNPLNNLLGWSRLLRSGKLEDRGRALDVIDRSAQALTRIVEDLIDLSRIASGKLRLELARQDLGEIVKLAAEEFIPSAAAKGVTFAVHLDRADHSVLGDKSRLQQIASNLFSNAVKFTPAGGRVDVSLRSTGTHAELAVADTGRGIAPELLPHVFDRFIQAEVDSARVGGLGLGLAIVKELVQLHRGKVVAESDGADRGATFRVTIPLAAASSATALPSSRF